MLHRLQPELNLLLLLPAIWWDELHRRLRKERSSMAQQGVQGGGPRPEPTLEDINTDIAKRWAEAGKKRAEEENYQDKSFVEKLQVQQTRIKDYAADKMNKAGEAIKSTVSGSGAPDR